jgi:hypothetical protein
MGKRNLTIQIDEAVAQRARMVAARRSTSVSRLVAEQIEALVLADAAYESARREAMDTMRRGFHLGGGALPARDSVHER